MAENDWLVCPECGEDDNEEVRVLKYPNDPHEIEFVCYSCDANEIIGFY